LPSIPEGENYLWHTARGGGMPLFGWRTRYWSFLLKLAKDRPAWTIQAQPGPATGPFHWTNRRLSSQELCRLQTFPDGLQFDCGRNDVQRMLGNAVPSLVAEVIAREIRGQLLEQPMKKKGCSSCHHVARRCHDPSASPRCRQPTTPSSATTPTIRARGWGIGQGRGWRRRGTGACPAVTQFRLGSCSCENLPWWRR